jgi:hypothetical protein
MPILKPTKVSMLDTVVAILWSFLGLRRQSDFEQDIVKINPVHLIVTGLFLGFAFVLLLMLVVYWVVA